MDSKLIKIYEKLKQDGLAAEQEQKILAEISDDATHDLPDGSPGVDESGKEGIGPVSKHIYSYTDLFDLQAITALKSTHSTSLRSIDELLDRDKPSANFFW